MSLDYGWEKFLKAVLAVAVSTSDVRQRLADAFVYHIIHVAPEDVPADVQTRLQTLRSAMTSVSAVGNEGNTLATTREMTTEEAKEWLTQIVSMYDEIARAKGKAD